MMGFNMDKMKKIVFAGLDFSGKTSIILTLNEEFSKLQNLKPTMGIETRTDNILGMKVVQWDIGGQEQFRKQYVKDKSHFENTDLLCYVIDVTDYSPERIQESIEYFKQILGVFAYFNFNPKIIVFLHKIDPDVQFQEEIKQNCGHIHRTISSIEEIQARKFEVDFFRTSIYNKWSLLKAFSHGITSLTTKTRTLTKIFEDFAKKNECKAITLKDDNLLTISEFYTDQIYEKIIEKFALSLIFAYKDLKKSTLKDFSKMLLEMDEEYMLIQRVNIIDVDFYVIAISSSKDVQKLVKKSLLEFLTNIESIVSNFFLSK
ncbi:MAG: hypothetical protein EAX96_03770 [Candidatus Lokiarchaeota archaeon]|nr:hypothetical protein [Candidatus Lokiarchaeota archaeon]